MIVSKKIPVYSVYNNYGHPPMALGMIIAYAKSYKDGLLNSSCEFIPQLLTSVETAKKTVAMHGPGIFLCSDYLWTAGDNLEITKEVKEWHSSSITIHGGPSVPKYDYSCESYLRDYPYVDIAVRGEGEMAVAEVLEQITKHSGEAGLGFLADTAGITYRSGQAGAGEFIRTKDRPQIPDVNVLPSPYLHHWFSDDDAKQWVAGILETNRGCPYGCTFCDWGSATLSKVRQFSFERVAAEIDWLSRRRIPILWIADANWGLLKRDLEIARTIAECKQKYGYPMQVVVNYAKHGSERIAQMVGILQSAGIAADGIISIQTHDPQTLKNINRFNIKTKHYEELIEIFRAQKLPISSDVMIGLPGSTIETFKADLQFFFDRQVYAKIFPTVVLPNSPMAHRDYMKEFKIQTDVTGQIVSTCSYTAEDMAQMKQIHQFYKFMIGYSLLKYLLYYLQLDHDIKAMDFIMDFRRHLNEPPGCLPETRGLIWQLMNTGGPPHSWVLRNRSTTAWKAFYREISQYLKEEYGIEGPVPDVVLLAQEKILPGVDRTLPERIPVAFDIGAYFRDVHSVSNLATLQGTHKKLSEYAAGQIEIRDPRGLCENTLDVVYDIHRIEWELESDLAWGRPAYHFQERVAV
jgi:hypothetical protein